MTSAAGGESAAGKSSFFLLEQYYLRNGTQLPRIHEFFGETLVPAAGRSHAGPMIILEGLVAPHMPQVAAIYGFESLDQVSEFRQGLQADSAFRKAHSAWEAGDEAPYEHYSSTLLRATAYNPPLVAATEGKTPRIFELRVYHSPTWRQLAALHERFAGPEIQIFHRVGVHPLFYTETLFGANLPNLTYLIPFQDLAEREKAWNAFGADPEWIRVRKESIDAHGQISAVIQISLFRATAYSPIR